MAKAAPSPTSAALVYEERILDPGHPDDPREQPPQAGTNVWRVAGDLGPLWSFDRDRDVSEFATGPYYTGRHQIQLHGTGNPEVRDLVLETVCDPYARGTDHVCCALCAGPW